MMWGCWWRWLASTVTSVAPRRRRRSSAMFWPGSRVSRMRSPGWAGPGWIRVSLDRARDVFAQDPAPGPMNLLGRSLADAARGEPGLAAAVIAEARRQFPGDALLAAQEGYLLLTSGRVIDGQVALEQAVARQPDQGVGVEPAGDHPPGARRQAGCARGRGAGAHGCVPLSAARPASAAVAQSEFRLADALAATDEALRLNPDHAGALVNRATLLFSTDRTDAAWKPSSERRNSPRTIRRS